MNIKQFVKTLDLQPQDIYRDDCPICGNTNTLSVRNTGTAILYNCFHADCNVKGSLTTEPTKQAFTIRKVFNTNSKFSIPNYFVSPLRNENAVKYLKQHNSWEAYMTKKISVMYDVKQDRVVFLVKDIGNNVIDGIGRALNKNSKLKWFRYGKSKSPFIVEGDIDKNTLVVVEDCPSACAVSSLYTGLALLGTSLPNSVLSTIKNRWSRVIICLDKDATDKSLKLVDKLSFYVNTDMKMLERDLKYENKDNIIKLFKSYSSSYEQAGDL